MEAFSDGVFAIAITLLVLQISVPERAFDDLWEGIGDQWPSYLAYVTSFVTIGGLWVAHHGLFRRLRYANVALMRANLLLLLVVSFLPFPTRLMAEGLRTDIDAERAAVLFYGATLFVISVIVTGCAGTPRGTRRCSSTASHRRTSSRSARERGRLPPSTDFPGSAAAGLDVDGSDRRLRFDAPPQVEAGLNLVYSACRRRATPRSSR